MITLKSGQSITELNGERELTDAVSEYLRIPLDYIRLNERSGEIQIKSPYGLKVVIQPTIGGAGASFEVIFC